MNKITNLNDSFFSCRQYWIKCHTNKYPRVDKTIEVKQHALRCGTQKPWNMVFERSVPIAVVTDNEFYCTVGAC